MTAKSKESHLTRRIASMVAAIVIGWLLCESLLRVLVPWPIFYSTWFSEGVHQRDPLFGFVFRPEYDGAMRHADQVWMEAIRLDSRGFRQSAIRSRRPQSAGGNSANQQVRIVMLGGASMAFCYGLADPETLHHQIADRLDRDCHIDLVSWPGFTLGQDMQKLTRMTDPSQYDIGVVLAYGDDDYRYRPDWDTVAPAANVHMLHSVVTPDDPAARLGGELYWHSYVVAGGCRLLRVPANWLASRASESDPPPRTPPVERPDDGKPQVLMACERLSSLGTDSVVIVALPHQSRFVGPPVLPDLGGISVLDLRREPETQQFDWIASGHYGPDSVKHLANEIAGLLESLE